MTQRTLTLVFSATASTTKTSRPARRGAPKMSLTDAAGLANVDIHTVLADLQSGDLRDLTPAAVRPWADAHRMFAATLDATAAPAGAFGVTVTMPSATHEMTSHEALQFADRIVEAAVRSESQAAALTA